MAKHTSSVSTPSTGPAFVGGVDQLFFRLAVSPAVKGRFGV